MKTELYNNFIIHIYNTIEEIMDIKDIWQKMQVNPNADYDYYNLIFETREEFLCPYVVVLTENDIPKALVVGRIETRVLDVKFGYKSIFSPKLKYLSIIYGGLMGEINEAISCAIVNTLLEKVNKQEVDILLINHLSIESKLYNILNKRKYIISRLAKRKVNRHWKMNLENNKEELKNRLCSDNKYQYKRLQRYSRSLNKNMSNNVSYKCFSEANHVDKICNDAESVARNTYHRALQVGFIDNNENREKMHLFANKGQLRAYMLYVGEKCISFWIGTEKNGTFFLEFTGYSQEYKQYDPGMLLFVYMIEDLCDKNVNTIDFGFGDAFYKNRFGDYIIEEITFNIFSNTFRNIILCIIYYALGFAEIVIKNIMEKYNIYGKVKSFMRKKIKNKIMQT